MVDEKGKVRIGVKEDHLTDIDAYYVKAYRKAVTATRSMVKSFDVVMLTSHCAEVLSYLEKQREKPSSATQNNYR